MKPYSFLMLIAAVLSLASCDRFKHTFEPADGIDLEALLFTPLQTALQTAAADSLSQVMSFFADDYLHNGQYKSDRESWFQSILQQDADAVFEVDFITSETVNDTLANANWSLTVYSSSKLILADSTFTGDRLVRRNETWFLLGNGIDCGCNPQSYQRVVIESFSGVTCTSCPDVDALLHQLQETYPANLSYLSYHFNDQLDSGNADVYSYYSVSSQPTVVFQGTTRIIGNNDNNWQFFSQLAQTIDGTQAEINLANLDFSLTDAALNGTVRIDVLNQSIVSDLLKLKYAVIDKTAEINYSGTTQPCRNVVLAKGVKSLQGLDLGEAVSFSLPLNSLPAVYGSTLPDDSYLVVWVQILPDPFDSNARIYNGLETYISLK